MAKKKAKKKDEEGNVRVLDCLKSYKSFRCRPREMENFKRISQTVTATPM